jgi:uncharacterized membrane protein
MKRFISWLALPVLLAGIFFRFHALDRQSLWDDEMSTIKTISLDSHAMMYRFRTYELHGPLFFLQLKLWKAMGNRSLVTLRANSAFWGSVGLLLLYGLARFYSGPLFALLVLTLAAFSPFHLAYSQELRPYALAMAIATAGMWLVEITVEKERQRGENENIPPSRLWLVLSVCWTAQLYTHYWGSFVVLAQAVYGLWKAPSKELRKRIAIALTIACGIFALWLPVLWEQLHVLGELAFWVPRFGVGNLLKTFVSYTSLFFNMASWSFYLPLRFGVFLLLEIAFFMVLLWGLRQKLVGPALWLGAALLPWIISYWEHSLYVWYRYPTHMLPAFFLLLAAGIFAARPKWLACLALCLCLGTEAWGFKIYFTAWQKANPKSVVLYIHHIRTPAAVVVRPSYFTELFRFYDAGTTPAVDEHLYDSPERRALLKRKQVILVAFDVPDDPIAAAFLSEYKPVSRQHFAGFAHLGITVYDLRAKA